MSMPNHDLFERLAVQYARRHQEYPETIWDADDILHPLMRRVCDKLGLDFATAAAVYHIRSNTLLSETQQDAILEAFADVRFFENIQFFPGVERIMLPAQYGAKVKIKSHSLSEAIAESKHNQLLAAVPGLKSSDIIMSVIGPDGALSKDFGKQATVVADDSPYNIATSQAVINLMPTNIPWSWNAGAIEMVREKCVIWKPSLLAMTDYVNTFIEYLARR